MVRVETKGVVRVLDVFLGLLIVGAFGMFLCILDNVEQALIRRQRAAEIRRHRAEVEEEYAELWPQRLQRKVYDQDEAA